MLILYRLTKEFMEAFNNAPEYLELYRSSRLTGEQFSESKAAGLASIKQILNDGHLRSCFRDEFDLDLDYKLSSCVGREPNKQDRAAAKTL